MPMPHGGKAAITLLVARAAASSLLTCSAPHQPRSWSRLGLALMTSAHPSPPRAATQPASRVTAHGLRFPGRHALERSVVQQRSTATTALSSTFGFIQMRPGQRKQGYKQRLRGVRDEEVTGSNPVTPTNHTRDSAIRTVGTMATACHSSAGVRREKLVHDRRAGPNDPAATDVGRPTP
jgi:hypothetical protein